MPKLGLAIIAVIITLSEFGFSQTATATQAKSPKISSILTRSDAIKDVRFITLAKKCTIRRYRRPH